MNFEQIEHDLREENARLRQRVQELERERDAAWVVRDAGWEQTEDALKRMRAAEAKLAEAERKHGALVETILALRVEVERLREALVRISSGVDPISKYPDGSPYEYDHLDDIEIARAALAPECRHGGRQQGETPCPDCSPAQSEPKAMNEWDKRIYRPRTAGGEDGPVQPEDPEVKP